MVAESDMLREFAEIRSRTYWFLSSIYSKKPDPEFVENLRLKLSEIDVHDDLGEIVGIMRESIDGDLHEISQRLAVEFTRLFRGVKKGYGPPPPYESVYRGEGRVMGETTLSVLKFYSKAGFGIIDESEGPQDYIGVELKFMSLLCYREMVSWEKGDLDGGKRYLELEKTFLEKHLLRWVPDFCRRVEAEAREEFYVAAAMLTENFLQIDAQNVKEMLEMIS